MITNIYLGGKYGIYDFALIKSRYVYTGVTFSLFCFIAFIGGYMLQQLIDVEFKTFLFSTIKIVIIVFSGLLMSGVYLPGLIFKHNSVLVLVELKFMLVLKFTWGCLMEVQ